MHDYLLEKRLSKEAPDLHRRVMNGVVVLQKMLESYLNWFPDYTDHSTLHSMDVLNFCNCLLGEQLSVLTVAECYALIMSCYLHDVGMGIRRDSFKTFIQKLGAEDYVRNHPEASESKIIRYFHNEFSGLFIREYSELFEIPSEELTFAIVQISRGHRKTDLYDQNEYPDIRTSYGIIRTAYLAAVLRLADEIDVGVDRNPELLFDISGIDDEYQLDIFGIHESIRMVDVSQDAITLHVKPKEPRFIPMIDDCAQKIRDTLNYCRDVAIRRSDLKITQEKVEVIYHPLCQP